MEKWWCVRVQLLLENAVWFTLEPQYPVLKTAVTGSTRQNGGSGGADATHSQQHLIVETHLVSKHPILKESSANVEQIPPA